MASLTEKTPGVYINEISAFPNSVVEVPTAIPCFIGYTEKAIRNNKDVTNKAVKLTKFSEFTTVFGGGPPRNLSLTAIDTSKPADVNLNILDPQKFRVSDPKKPAVAVTFKTDFKPNPGTPAGPNGTSAAVPAASIKEQIAALSAEANTYIITGGKVYDKSGNVVIIKPFKADTYVKGTNNITKKKPANTASPQGYILAAPNSSKLTSFTLGQAANTLRFYLFDSMQMFYQNGGGTCYVISLGSYPKALNPQDMTKAIDVLEDHPEPTMLVLPDALSFEAPASCYSTVYQHMLAHCEKVQNRVAIMDVWRGFQDIELKSQTGLNSLPVVDPVFEDYDMVYLCRDGIGTGAPGLKYGIVYYPWVQTSMNGAATIDFSVFTQKAIGTIQGLLKTEVLTKMASGNITPQQYATAQAMIGQMSTTTDVKKISQLHQNLLSLSPNLYKTIMKEAAYKMNIMPVAAAMAGVYTRIDNEIGVWEAPANTGMVSVVGPMVQINNDQQQDLNVPLDGLAVNAIREFTNRGTLIWGARTLDGNSEDNRYINVRRTLIMIEQSIKNASEAYVFDPNDDHTWNSVKAMIENFLNTLWKEGALVGPSPATAYKVAVGAATMNATDILDGYMRVTVMVALSHPAEFIMITFEQMQQTL